MFITIRGQVTWKWAELPSTANEIRRLKQEEFCHTSHPEMA